MIAIRRGVVFPFGCRYDAIIGRSKTRTRIAAARISAAARREATAATFIADLSSHASVRRLATEVLARYPMSIRCERRRNSSILFRHAFVLLMALTACSFCAQITVFRVRATLSRHQLFAKKSGWRFSTAMICVLGFDVAFRRVSFWVGLLWQPTFFCDESCL